MSAKSTTQLGRFGAKLRFKDMARVTKRQLEGFHNWICEYGRTNGTADLYVHNIRAAYRGGGPLKRLNDKSLAPKTRRHILAACRAWAKYREDTKLTVSLERLKLPPATRATEKIPMTREQWLDLIHYIDESEMKEPLRAQLGMMATRGFRRGDVLRMERKQIVRSLKTGTITYVAKGGVRLPFRVISTYRRYLEILADHTRWSRVSDLICPRAEKPHTAAGKAVARALNVCGIEIGLEDGEVHPHRLRRTYATLYLQALGSAPDAVERLRQHMGWRSLATAMQYIDHARGVELDDVAERMFDE